MSEDEPARGDYFACVDGGCGGGSCALAEAQARGERAGEICGAGGVENSAGDGVDSGRGVCDGVGGWAGL